VTEFSWPDKLLILYWVPEADRWASVDLRDWIGFVGANRWTNEAALKGALPNIAPGIAYFVICVLDNDDVTPVNIIPHKCLIEPGGYMGPDNFAGFTREDRRDYWELMLKREPTSADSDRYDELGSKGYNARLPPKDSAFALVRALIRSPKRGSAAERFLLKWLAR
jgi:hypothetical protein